MNQICTQLLQCNGISQWLTATLKCKRDTWISDRETLSIDCTKRETPIIRIDSSQLRNITSNFSVSVTLTLPEELFNVFCKSQEVWNHQLMTESTSYQDDIWLDDTEITFFNNDRMSSFKKKTNLRLKCLPIQILGLGRATLRIACLMNLSQVFYELDNTWVISSDTTCA